MNKIPTELRDLPQWVAWKKVPSKKHPGKSDKIPINPHTGELASHSDRKTWSTFEHALAAMQKYKLHGVGFVFTSDDPYVFIDFDDVVGDDGEIEQWVLDCLWRLSSYAEYSQSKHGVHVIVQGALPPEGRKSEHGEMYETLRFAAMTGDVIGDYSEIREAQEAVNYVHALLFPPKQPKPEPVQRPAHPVTLADADLLAKAQAAHNGAKFQRLWDGSSSGYPSQSEADLALCGQLAFWTGGDPSRMDTLFRSSGLYRPEKWDKVHHSDGSTYGEHTIAVAIRNAPNFYDGNGRQPPDVSYVAEQLPPEPPPWLDADGLEVPDLPPMPPRNGTGKSTDEPARVLPTPKPDLSECQPLPESARLPVELEAHAFPWLDAYIAFSRRCSPRAYDGFHESVGLWVLSTIAARRVMVPLGGERFPNLYIANVARSSVWAKSTTHKIGAEVIEAAGLQHLLAPDDSTPQALMQRMGRRQTVTEWDALPPDQQELARLRIAFAAQRGWDFDEFGHKVAAMMRDSGAMADFRGILRKLDDCPKSYEYVTIAHGSILLDRPYLSLLGSMTPADMQPYAKRGGPLWGDGFWARFAFVAPAPEETASMERFREGVRVIPPALITPLRKWHTALGTPTVEVTERTETDESGKPKAKKWDVRVGPAPVQTCTLGAGVFDAFYNYHDALVMLAQANDNTDLDGNYSRFAEKALRVAVLLASLENGGLIELRHWARAQAIAERWRQSLHNLYRTLNASQNDESRDEERVIKIVDKLGTPTPTEVHRYLPDLTTNEVIAILDRLTRAGTLKQEGKTKFGTARYSINEP